jgi:hypothetical protein
MLNRLATGSLLLVFAMVMHIQDGHTQAEPKGWRCEYRIFEGTAESPRLYNCYGAHLDNTRARTKGRCVVNALCNAGACLPLDFAPRTSCER